MNWGHPGRDRVLLFAGDAALAALATAVAMFLHPGYPVSVAQRGAGVLAFTLLFLACLYVLDLYDLVSFGRLRLAFRLLVAAGAATTACSALLYFVPWIGLSRSSLVISVPVFIGSAFFWRVFYVRYRGLFSLRQSVLVVGTEDDALTVASAMKADNPQYEFLGLLRTGFSPTQIRAVSGLKFAPVFSHSSGAPRAVATLAGPSGQAMQALQEPQVLEQDALPAAHAAPLTDLGWATAQRLEEVVARHEVNCVILRADSAAAELSATLTRLRFSGVRVCALPDFYNKLMEELPLETLTDSWLSFTGGFNLLQMRIFRKVKRLMDILLAGAGLLVSLPLLLAAAAAIKLESPGPVLFRQRRVGWMERPFDVLKLRSMRCDAESDGRPQWAQPNDPRVTRVGRLIRKLHIDEIPQMANVLAGDMSFVGPRPERPTFVDQLKSQIPFYHLRHYVPPGITGWAQVNYPYADSVADARRKLQFDLYYIQNASPVLDLRIVLRTARVILFQRGSR